MGAGAGLAGFGQLLGFGGELAADNAEKNAIDANRHLLGLEAAQNRAALEREEELFLDESEEFFNRQALSLGGRGVAASGFDQLALADTKEQTRQELLQIRKKKEFNSKISDAKSSALKDQKDAINDAQLFKFLSLPFKTGGSILTSSGGGS